MPFWLKGGSGAPAFVLLRRLGWMGEGAGLVAARLALAGRQARLWGYGLEQIVPGVLVLCGLLALCCWLCGFCAGCCCERVRSKRDCQGIAAPALSPQSKRRTDQAASGLKVSPPKGGFATGPRARRKILE